MYTPKLTVLTTTTILEANTWLKEAIRLAFEMGAHHVRIPDQGMSCAIDKDGPVYTQGCAGERGETHFGWIFQSFVGPVFVREKQLLQAAINNGLNGKIGEKWFSIVPAVGTEIVVL